MEELIINNYPFFTGLKIHLSENEIPKTFPMIIEYDEESNMIKQKYSKNIENHLKKSYQVGSNISSNLGSGTFGYSRSEDVLKYLLMYLGNDISKKSFLEIGCADGYILNQLLKRGAKDVLGCEPGLYEGIKKFKNVKILRDFYTPQKIKEKFDVILSLGVLEHIYNPKDFIKLQIKSLKKGGGLFFSVPNSENKLNLGDVKLLQHEHWNYFTKTSISNMFYDCGFNNISITISDNDANIFVWAFKDNNIIYKGERNKSEKYLFKKFCSKINKSKIVLRKKIEAIIDKNYSIGFIGGGPEVIALLPYIENPRFFDNDVSKQGKFIPGFLNPIEDPKNILKERIDEIWICATDYDDQISDGLKSILPNDVKIFSIKKMLLSI